MDHTLIEHIGNLFRSIKGLAQAADQNHAYRYVKLVESSNVGHDCKYAVASHRLWLQSKQRESTIDTLEKLRADIDQVIELYKQDLQTTTQDSNATQV